MSAMAPLWVRAVLSSQGEPQPPRPARHAHQAAPSPLRWSRLQPSSRTSRVGRLWAPVQKGGAQPRRGAESDPGLPLPGPWSFLHRFLTQPAGPGGRSRASWPWPHHLTPRLAHSGSPVSGRCSTWKTESPASINQAAEFSKKSDGQAAFPNLWSLLSRQSWGSSEKARRAGYTRATG